MELLEKEVYFSEYCHKCVNELAPEESEVCDDCLAHPSNLNSHKPVNFKEKVGKK